jgi:hypothetical protein
MSPHLPPIRRNASDMHRYTTREDRPNPEETARKLGVVQSRQTDLLSREARLSVVIEYTSE